MTPWQLDSSDPFNLLDRVGEPNTVIDIGCGKNDSPISKQVRDIYCDELWSVDAWQPYIDDLDNLPFATRKHICHTLDIKQIVTEFREFHFDLALCLDSIEHLDKQDGHRLLSKLTQIASEVLVWIPIGADPVESLDGNPYQQHKATWTAEELVELGYTVKVFSRVHTKNPPVDAAWCWKGN